MEQISKKTSEGSYKTTLVARKRGRRPKDPTGLSFFEMIGGVSFGTALKTTHRSLRIVA